MAYGNTSLTKKAVVKQGGKNNEQIKQTVSCYGEKLLHVMM